MIGTALAPPRPEEDEPVRYIELNLLQSPVGSGTRTFVVVEERGSRARLLYVPMLRAFWVDARELKNTRDLPTRGLAARIREVRRERNLLNMSYSGPATRQVLDMLRGGASPTPEEEKDDALWGAREVDDETTNNPNEGETDMITDDLGSALDPNAPASSSTTPSVSAAAAAKKKLAAAKPAAKPAKAAAAKPAKAAVVADSKISGKPAPSPNAAAVATAPKKAAAKPAKKAAAGGVRTKWDGSEKIKLLTKENPSRPGSRLFKFFAELSDGTTIKQAQDVMKKKHSVPEPTTNAMLRHMVTWGKLKVAA